jgi:hypothetical protein
MAGFEVITYGRFWVIAKDGGTYFDVDANANPLCRRPIRIKDSEAADRGAQAAGQRNHRDISLPLRP